MVGESLVYQLSLLFSGRREADFPSGDGDQVRRGLAHGILLPHLRDDGGSGYHRPGVITVAVVVVIVVVRGGAAGS